MATLTLKGRLDFGGASPDAARAAIKDLLSREPQSTRKVYAALAHKVWTLLIERRLDAEIRDWHALLMGTKAFVRPHDNAAAERLSALGDLLRESISLAETSPAREVAQRPQARRILAYLLRAKGEVARRSLMEALALGSSHLSNILTQLVAHGLVERQDKGKEVDLSLSPLGRQIALELSRTGPDVRHTTTVLDDHIVDTLMLSSHLQHYRDLGAPISRFVWHYGPARSAPRGLRTRHQSLDEDAIVYRSHMPALVPLT